MCAQKPQARAPLPRMLRGELCKSRVLRHQGRCAASCARIARKELRAKTRCYAVLAHREVRDGIGRLRSTVQMHHTRAR